MNRIRAVALPLCLLAIAGGCAPQLRPPNLADETRAAIHWPGTTVADLERGQQLYVGHCSSCHQLYRPESYPPDKWRGFVNEMMTRAKLQPPEGQDVIRYLVTAAEATPAGPGSDPRRAAQTNLAGVGATGDRAAH